LKHFQAKACPALDAGWVPVRVKKTRQEKDPPLGTGREMRYTAARANPDPRTIPVLRKA
jgi:hypothetical protein